MSRDRMPFLVILATLLVLACGLWEAHASGGAVTLGWSAQAGATGYKVYSGQAPGSYTEIKDVGPSLETVVCELTPGVTYYFAATAYNMTGESGYSNEVSWTEPLMLPPIPAPPVLHIVTTTPE